MHSRYGYDSNGQPRIPDVVDILDEHWPRWLDPKWFWHFMALRHVYRHQKEKLCNLLKAL